MSGLDSTTGELLRYIGPFVKIVGGFFLLIILTVVAIQIFPISPAITISAVLILVLLIIFIVSIREFW